MASALDEDSIRTLELLSREGQQACEARRYARCHQKFIEAQQILEYAPQEYYLAEALVGMGRLVQGAEVWNELLRKYDPDNSDPGVRWAYRRARERLKAIEPIIPRVRLSIPSPFEQTATVFWGGEQLTREHWSKPFQTNPGKYFLRASAPGMRPFAGEYELISGQNLDVTVAFDALARNPKEPSTANAWRIPLALSTLGAGVVATATGAFVWNSMKNNVREVEQRCGTSQQCETTDELQRLAETVESQERTGNLLFVVGGSLLATGSGLLIWDLSAEGPIDAQKQLSAQLAPDGVRMSFSGKF